MTKRIPKKKRPVRSSEIEITESSGNVFADLGLPNADELFARAAELIAERKARQKRRRARKRAKASA